MQSIFTGIAIHRHESLGYFCSPCWQMIHDSWHYPTSTQGGGSLGPGTFALKTVTLIHSESIAMLSVIISQFTAGTGAYSLEPSRRYPWIATIRHWRASKGKLQEVTHVLVAMVVQVLLRLVSCLLVVHCQQTYSRFCAIFQTVFCHSRYVIDIIIILHTFGNHDPERGFKNWKM